MPKARAPWPARRFIFLPIQGEDIQSGRFKNDSLMAKLDASDAVIFGSPTYMGGPAAQFKGFADATGERWFKAAWHDKLAAGFTVSGGPSGDKLSTLHYFFTLAMQHGMIWVGLAESPFNDKGINRLSSYSGVMGQAMQEPPEVAPNEADKLTGESLRPARGRGGGALEARRGLNRYCRPRLENHLCNSNSIG